MFASGGIVGAKTVMGPTTNYEEQKLWGWRYHAGADTLSGATAPAFVCRDAPALL